MKIAVSVAGKDLEAKIDPRFGRCAYFIIVETNDMSYEVFGNESRALGGGAGIQSAEFVASKGAKIVITGSLGPNAVRALSSAGIQSITGQSGTAREAVDDYNRGKLKAKSDNVPDYGGKGAGGRMGRGMGRGRVRG